MQGTTTRGEAASSAHLVGRLRKLVVDGSMPVDVPVSLADIARKLRVNRQRAYEIVMELGRDGFLAKVDDDHVRVRRAEEFVPDQIVEIRRHLEPVAVREAARFVRAADLITLKGLVVDVEAAIEAHDFTAFLRADKAFGMALLRLHPNAELTRLCFDLRHRTPADGFRNAIELGEIPQCLCPHRELVRLIEARDFDGVERLVSEATLLLDYVGSPRMDDPWLAGAPIKLEAGVDIEFLDPDS